MGKLLNATFLKSTPFLQILSYKSFSYIKYRTNKPSYMSRYAFIAHWYFSSFPQYPLDLSNDIFLFRANICS
jgi:hypothetical protein